MQIFSTALHPIKAWVDGVEFAGNARAQLENIASLPFAHSHVSVMPDVHHGIGATVGSVIATCGAIVPAAVGVDIGCGMIAQRTTLRDTDLPDDLKAIRSTIERTVPVGFATHSDVPASVSTAWDKIAPAYNELIAKHPKIEAKNSLQSLGTMGGGNHFCEVTIDEEGYVWVVLHSGSRGAGNRIGKYFIERAKREMGQLGIGLVDRDLAYFTDSTESFHDYVDALEWA